MRAEACGTSVQRLVVAERSCALHDADGVGVELAGDAGLGLVLAEGEHADAGDEDDGGAGVALLGRVG